MKEIAAIFFAYSRDKYEELFLTNLHDYLQAADVPVAQTAPYPLALANINGNMRSSQKSLFQSTITQLPNLKFMSELPPLALLNSLRY